MFEASVRVLPLLVSWAKEDIKKLLGPAETETETDRFASTLEE